MENMYVIMSATTLSEMTGAMVSKVHGCKKGRTRRTSIESDIGTNVDEAQNNGEHTRHSDRVSRYLELGIDMSNPVAKRKAMVSSKCPSLSGCRQVVRQGAGEDENGRDGIEGDNTTAGNGLGKHPHMWVAGCIVQCSIHIRNHEDVADEKDYA